MGTNFISVLWTNIVVSIQVIILLLGIPHCARFSSPLYTRVSTALCSLRARNNYILLFQCNNNFISTPRNEQHFYSASHNNSKLHVIPRRTGRTRFPALSTHERSSTTCFIRFTFAPRAQHFYSAQYNNNSIFDFCLFRLLRSTTLFYFLSSKKSPRCNYNFIFDSALASTPCNVQQHQLY